MNPPGSEGRSQKARMLAGELYRPGDPEIQAFGCRRVHWAVRMSPATAAGVADKPIWFEYIVSMIDARATALAKRDVTGSKWP